MDPGGIVWPEPDCNATHRTSNATAATTHLRVKQVLLRTVVTCAAEAMNGRASTCYNWPGNLARMNCSTDAARKFFEKRQLRRMSQRAVCFRMRISTTPTPVGVEGPLDLARYEVTKREQDPRKFKTPSLRNIALTAPDMLDGSVTTLGDAVEFHSKGANPNPNLDHVREPN